MRDGKAKMRITVIGGGPGGMAAALEAASSGAQVTLVEKDRLGGTCLNRGCIPAKTLLRSAKVASDTRNAEELGLDCPPARVDVDRLRARKESVVDELVGQAEAQLRRAGVRIVSGEGRLIDASSVEVASANGALERVESDAVILATGSKPFELPGVDQSLPRVWTSDDALNLAEIPKDIVVIGAGAVGLEFACAYAAFGSKVIVVEMMDQILPGIDRRASRVVLEGLERAGVTFRLRESVSLVEHHEGRVRVTLAGGSELLTDVVLNAAGRVPDIAAAGVGQLGLEMRGRALKVDEYFRTSVEGVWAIGDLIGGMMLAHVAEEEGVLAARNVVDTLKGNEPSSRLEPDFIPACVYTFPEAASVGATRESARASGIDVVQAISKLTANGKALAEGEPYGFVAIVAEKGSGKIVGAQIVGPHAVEIVHEIAVAMRNGLPVQSLAATVHAHPTISEALKVAAIDCSSKI